MASCVLGQSHAPSRPPCSAPMLRAVVRRASGQRTNHPGLMNRGRTALSCSATGDTEGSGCCEGSVVVGINEPLNPLFSLLAIPPLDEPSLPHDVEIHLSEATTSHLFLTVTSSSLSVSHGLSSPLQSLSQILSTSSPTSFNASAA